MSSQIVSQIKTVLGITTNDYDFVIVIFACFLLFYMFIMLSNLLNRMFGGKC